jgi:hypothetical protein
MGFDTAVDSMVSLALSNAAGFFSDLVPFIAATVGVILVGTIIAMFVKK